MQRVLGLLLGVALAAAGERAFASPQPEADDRRAILVFIGDDFSRPWVQGMIDGFRTAVLSRPNPPVLYVETLDALRFGDQAYIEEFRDWLRLKYRERKIDLIVPLGEEGLDFLARKSGEPWPGVPILYADVGSVSVDTRRDLPQAIGMSFEDSFPASLGVIKQILPGTRRVALVMGASELEWKRFGGFADKVRQANLGLEPLPLNRPSLEATVEAASHLPDDAVVFILAPATDATGRTLTQTEACERLSAAANRPSFLMGRHDLGCGAVGGLLRDFRIFGSVVGERALARLAGDTTPMVHVPMERYTTLAFDARQLSRWSIAESSLPANSTILFRQENLWRDHRRLILAVLAVVAVQTCLIAGLIVEHRRRRRAEIEGRQHLAAMAHLDRLAVMGELTASVAHELNQPLGAILQNAEAAKTLLDRQDPKVDTLKEIVEDIRNDDKRAREVIRRLRTLLRKHELETEPLDVNELARDTVALAAFDADSKGVKVTVDVPPTPSIVAGDRVHLQQALLNLVLNGMEAMADVPEERRRLTVRATPNHQWIDVAVIDSGPGISQNPPSKIFEPFVTSKGDGMGMGLSIARSIVEAHGGRIDARTNDGGGATVHFTLPLQRQS